MNSAAGRYRCSGTKRDSPNPRNKRSMTPAHSAYSAFTSISSPANGIALVSTLRVSHRRSRTPRNSLGMFTLFRSILVSSSRTSRLFPSATSWRWRHSARRSSFSIATSLSRSSVASQLARALANETSSMTADSEARSETDG